jgi:hypothetical protein
VDGGTRVRRNKTLHMRNGPGQVEQKRGVCESTQGLAASGAVFPQGASACVRSRGRITVASDLAQPHRAIRTCASCCNSAALGHVLAKVSTTAHGCSGMVSITSLAKERPEGSFEGPVSRALAAHRLDRGTRQRKRSSEVDGRVAAGHGLRRHLRIGSPRWARDLLADDPLHRGLPR